VLSMARWLSGRGHDDVPIAGLGRVRVCRPQNNGRSRLESVARDADGACDGDNHPEAAEQTDQDDLLSPIDPP
jgi:hypothetical protein